MKDYAGKTAFIWGLVVFLISQSQIYSQEKPNSISLNDILVKLTFTSRISHSTEEINQQLIKDIRERKVNFILSSEGEKWVKEAGGSESLIKEIHANVTEDARAQSRYEKYIEEANALYQKFKDNYKGNLAQKKLALDTANEFIERYGDEKNIKEEFRGKFKEDFKDIIQFLKGQIKKLIDQTGGID